MDKVTTKNSHSINQARTRKSHSMQQQLTPTLLIMLHPINHIVWIMIQNMSNGLYHNLQLTQYRSC
jgi:hypothetical protein